MIEAYPAEVVAAGMQPIAAYDVPHQLCASVESQRQTLLGLASHLAKAGMDAHQVRSVIEQACSSYLDELACAIFVLRTNDET